VPAHEKAGCLACGQNNWLVLSLFGGGGLVGIMSAELNALPNWSCHGSVRTHIFIRTHTIFYYSMLIICFIVQ
jgi:hypothetical protein